MSFRNRRPRGSSWEQLYVIDPQSGCWIWIGGQDGNGYGSYYHNYKVKHAHRFVFEQFKGQIPLGMDLDHLCRVPLCVNPEHLEVVTRAINARRGNNTSLTQDDVNKIREIYKTRKIKQRDLGRMFGTSGANISEIVRNETWKG